MKINPIKSSKSPKSNKDKFLRNIGFGLLILLLILSVVGLYGQPLAKEKEVSLSRLVEEINDENIEAIDVNQEEITATLKDSDTKLVTRKEAGVSVTETLKNLGVSEDRIKSIGLTVSKPSGFAFWASTLLPVLLPFLLLGGFLWFMMRSAQNASGQAMGFGQTKSRPVESEKKKSTSFADVAGNEESKNELSEVVEFLKTPKKFQKMGARIPKGVMLVGPPGTGKTLMARAVAGEANVPFFTISGSEFVEMFVGVGASRVRDLFQKVKQQSPAILFIDELDAVGRQRGAGLGGGHDEREQTLNQILTEMDGFEQNEQIIVIAATNRPDVLDPALLRPGRFDRQVIMELPDIKEREAIMKIHTKKVSLAKNVDLRNIAERTPGFSGADLANLINEAAILAARSDDSVVRQSHIEESIEKVMLGPERKSRVFSEKEKRVTAYHEAGHAVVAHFTPESDPVRKVSIVSRGHAGGYTLKLPEEDKRLHTRTGFLSELSTLMGGYTAELMKFKELTTGASNDLRQATKLARRIVTDFGMSALGPMTFGQKEEYVFLGKELHESRDYSEKTAAKIDEQIANILTSAHDKSKEVLTNYNHKLELVAQTLMKKETIGQTEFKRMMSEDYEKEEAGSEGSDSSAKSKDKKCGETAGSASPAPAPAT